MDLIELKRCVVFRLKRKGSIRDKNMRNGKHFQYNEPRTRYFKHRPYIKLHSQVAGSPVATTISLFISCINLENLYVSWVSIFRKPVIFFALYPMLDFFSEGICVSVQVELSGSYAHVVI